jgi:hypothetical protein
LTAVGETVDDGCLSREPNRRFFKITGNGFALFYSWVPSSKAHSARVESADRNSTLPSVFHSRQMSASRRQCDTCRRYCRRLQTLDSAVLPEDHLQKMHILRGNNISGELCDLRFHEGLGSGATVNLRSSTWQVFKRSLLRYRFPAVFKRARMTAPQMLPCRPIQSSVHLARDVAVEQLSFRSSGPTFPTPPAEKQIYSRCKYAQWRNDRGGACRFKRASK